MTFLAKVERFPSMQAYYDGATSGRRGASIRRSNADPNVIGYTQLPRLRSGARDLVRNNAHARRAVEAIVSNTVGDGIKPQFTRDGVRAEDIEALADLSLETTECDSDGLLTFHGIQALALQATVEGGDVIIRRRWRRSSDGLAVPVQFQVLEPEYLDESKDGPTRGGGKIIQGVEFDALGRRRFYWLYRDHPGGRHFRAESRPVPAEDIAHVYRVERPGQVRGIPWAAAVMLAHADFGDYEDAQVMRQKIAACFAGFWREPFDTSLPGSSEKDDDGNIIDTLEPGMFERMPPGAEIEFADPPGVEGYGEYSNVTLHKIAMGWGISYEMLTGDLRGVNFASGKMGRLEAQLNIERWQRLMMIPMLCDRLTGWWLEAVALTGVNVEGVKVRHTPPPNAMVDPPKEMRADIEAILSGQKTWTQVLRERGKDPVEHFMEYAEDMRLIDSLGIVLTSDARQRRDTPTQPAEPEDAADEIAGLLAARNGAHR